MSAGTATGDAPARTHAAPEPEGPAPRPPFPAAAAALFDAPGVPGVNAVLAGVAPDAATRAIAAVPDFGALLTDPAPPLPPSVQAAVGPAVGADLDVLALRTGAAVDAVLRLAGVDGLIAGRTLLLPTEHATTDTPEGGRLLLAAVQQALGGVAGPVDLTRPLVDPMFGRPPPGVGAEPAPPEAPIDVPEAPSPEVAPVEDAPAPEPEAEAGPGAAEPAPAVAGSEAPAEEAPPEEAPSEEAPTAVELIMPPAPAAPGPEQQARQAKVGGAARAAAGAASALPSAEATTDAARAAVVEPPEETAGRARGALALELGQRPPPSPEIVALCEKIQTAIRKRRPVDEDALRAANPETTAQEVGAGLNSSVNAQAGKVQEGYDVLGNPPAGSPQLSPQGIQTPPATVADPGVNATQAVPDAIPPENLSLDADSAAVDQKIADANIERPTTEPIAGPPFSTVREERAELGALAVDKTAEVAAQQSEALGRAQQGMAELQVKALKSLQTSRQTTVTRVSGGQQAAKGSEQDQRAGASRDAQAIFNQARTDVMAIVGPLASTAMDRWNAGVAILSTQFKNHLAVVKGSVDERHEGAIGSVVGLWDDWTGLPDWITDEYTKAETAFGDGVCELLTEISRDVNSVIAAAQVLIATARTDIDKVFNDLPESLRTWADGERRKFGEQLDGLDQQVEAARTGFITDVSGKAIAAVAEVQAEVEKLREAAKGKLAKIYDAIAAFLEDPIKAIIEGLLLILGIPPPAFWALVARIKQVIEDIADDPVSFLNNLVAAVKQGFEQFFDNFGTHVIAGFWKWLFQGLTKLGVTIPADVSVGSLIKLALQVMGISWPRIRGVLVKHIGERNVALIEHAWTIISTLVEKGPDGILELLKEQLDPAKLIGQIVSAAVDYLIETLIKKVALRIIGMLNPAGAILQAIQLIYTVLVWIFQNAARIFQLVEAVVGGIANIIAGNIGGAAAVVEKALAATIPVVIDFLAELLGLGDLPWKIADIVKKLQAYVLSIIDRVIGFLVERAKALLGIGGDDKGAGDKELGKEVKFSGAGESHRQWIDPAGTPMMASTTETVAARLGEWKTQLATEFKGDDAKRATVGGLIDKAQGTLANVVNLAAGLAKAYQDPKAETPPPSDDELEAAQVELAGTLTEIFVAFGGDPDAFRKDIKAELPTHGDKRARALIGTWHDRIGRFRIGVDPDAAALWPGTPLAGTESGAIAVTNDANEQEQLLPYFTTAPSERRTAAADAFGEYALVQQSAPHSVRRDFTVALGNQAASVLKTTGAANVNSAPAEKTSDEYKAKLLGLIADIGYTWTPTGGTWTLPTENLPDHDRYRPESIVISDGGRTVTYTTKTKQSFTVTLDPKTALTTAIVGRNLRMGMALPGQRGVTKRSPGFEANRDFNAAHLIADRFGGSGYVAGLNLATTSAEYNQGDMAEVEDRIAAAVEAHAAKLDVERTEVSFDLRVEMTTGALASKTVLSAIKAKPEFKAGDTFDAEIVKKIVAGEIVPELRRVLSTKYTLFLDGKVALQAELKEDVDLLKGG